jgi:alkanesulfonate monooxygenase SsuD/methylene tetrahydromethanopterin reductase-like flavin-dependent oxidoreductase (luciferase family)
VQIPQLAESLGFDSYLLPDHPTIGYECWTTLAAVAMATNRIKLGTLTSCIYYRNPVLLARAASDVDRISNGRLVLGIGFGNVESEFMALGIPWRSVHERQEALEETVYIMRGLWSRQPFTYRGTHFHLREANGAPGPLQQPHVPLIIGGGGERVTLRQVAQYADASNFAASNLAGSAFTLDDVKRKFAALRQHCAEIDRPYDSVLRTYLDVPVILAETRDAVQAKLASKMSPKSREFWKTSLLAVTPEEAIAHYRGLVAAGVQYFMVQLMGNDVETLRLLGERVLPAVANR